jgi:hypothetical protein
LTEISFGDSHCFHIPRGEASAAICASRISQSLWGWQWTIFFVAADYFFSCSGLGIFRIIVYSGAFYSHPGFEETADGCMISMHWVTLSLLAAVDVSIIFFQIVLDAIAHKLPLNFAVDPVLFPIQ